MLDWVPSFVALLCAFLGPFSLMDSLTPEKVRQRFSEYLFGFHGLTAKEFERLAIEIWVGVFFEGIQIKKIKLLLVSFSLTFGPFLFLFFSIVVSNGVTGEQLLTLLYVALLSIGIAFFSFPIDVINLKISRWIYFGKPRHLGICSKLALDIFLSFFASFLAILVFYSFILFLVFLIDTAGIDISLSPSFNDGDDRSPFAVLFGSSIAFGPLFSVFQFLIVRTLVICVGMIVRLLMTASNLNSYTVLFSNAQNYPMTFVGLVFFIFSYFLSI